MKSAASCLHQLLKFIYTGELEGSASPQLKELAEKYEISHLERLCKAAYNSSQDDDLAEDLDRMALLLKTDADILEISKSKFEVEMEPKPDTCIVKVTWTLPADDVDKLVRPLSNSTERSKTLSWFSLEENCNEKNCSARITRDKQRKEISINFLVHQDPENQNYYSVEEVSCAFVNEDELQRVKMTLKIPGVQNSIRVFFKKLTSVYDFPRKITFYVKLLSTVPSFSFKFANTRIGYDLQRVAIDNSVTDVELLVDDNSFFAHRALLSARSPVFAAMFRSGMKEDRTGRVVIIDVDPETFDHFLRFLYEGKMGSWDRAMKKKLFALADRYEVETLMGLCQPTRSVKVLKK